MGGPSTLGDRFGGLTLRISIKSIAQFPFLLIPLSNSCISIFMCAPVKRNIILRSLGIVPSIITPVNKHILRSLDIVPSVLTPVTDPVTILIDVSFSNRCSKLLWTDLVQDERDRDKQCCDGAKE